MGQLLQIKQRGLYTSPNEFSGVPEGALTKADNCNIDTEHILESRRGINRDSALPLASDRGARLAFYQSQRLAAWSGGKVGYKNPGTGVWTPFSGTFNHPDSLLARLRFLESANNLYFTTAAGVYRLDAYNGTPALAGMPRGLDIQVTASGASGFLATSNQCAYRILWGKKDANGNIPKGAPSSRAVFINTSGGSRDCALTSSIPSGVDTSFFFQVYRSGASGGAAVEPNDELQLVYENNPTSTDLTNGYISFTDSTPDSLRGETLYTSPSQEGITQSNDRPPLCRDFVEFQTCVIYAATKSKQRKIFTLLGVGGSTGVAIGDVLTIAGTSYTAAAAENIAALQFAVVTSGTPSQNIADTARSLERVINRNTTNTTVYAVYLSGYQDVPGKLLIEERGIGGAAFSITASARGTAYNPVLPTSGTSVTSSNDDFQHQLMFAKTGEPEAVPLVNSRPVGSANKAILRVFKLRNSVIIFKQDEGVWRLTGTDPESFDVEPIDSSANLLAPDTVALLNNQIWCLTDQGVTIVTETGATVVSRPIEDLILDQFGLALDQVRYYSHGAGYESDRKYILFTVSSSGDTYATQAFCFNSFTTAFTRWPIAKSTALVNKTDGKLYLCDALSSWTEVERKTRTFQDYVDYGVTYTILSTSSAAGVNRVYLTTTNEIAIGDRLYQSASVQSLILDVQPGYVVVADNLAWTVGSVTVLKAIDCKAEWAAVTGENPGTLKQFPEISFLFRSARFNSATVSFATDQSAYFEDVPIYGSRAGLWGLFGWGTAAWGSTATSIPVRTFVPLEKQRGSLIRVRFSHREGYGVWRLNGFSMPIRDTESHKVTR